MPRLLDHCPELRTAHDLVRRCAAMLDNHDATDLPEWLNDLANTGLAPLTGLARALHEDRHAVTQGITAPYNSGVNEGRITDVKLQKRIMAGRRLPPQASRRPDRPPPTTLRGPANRAAEMISAYENLARATFLLRRVRMNVPSCQATSFSRSMALRRFFSRY
ncbi:hypothetical protein ACFWBC_35300 [Streptomyces sp. NPDC059985]|uniref:hypothetical protein n=1 Tax=Streptomyces sp. NPDC059985 TaxID=3347025 RepID=UPI0036884B46